MLLLFFSHFPPFSPHKKNCQHKITYNTKPKSAHSSCKMCTHNICDKYNVPSDYDFRLLENAAYEMKNFKLYYFSENIFVEWLFVRFICFVFFNRDFSAFNCFICFFTGPPKFANLNFDFYIIWLNVSQ